MYGQYKISLEMILHVLNLFKLNFAYRISSDKSSYSNRIIKIRII